jgi:nucleoredoxin
MFGDELVFKGGATVNTSTALASKEAIGIYFSAHWCPPCRGFTPTLCDKYTALKAAGKNVEMVFVSSDQDEDAFSEYFGTMPFLALPFSKRDLKGELSSKFGVSGIPSLIFIDGKTGEIITKGGRGAISAPTYLESFPYHPKPSYDVGESTVSLFFFLCVFRTYFSFECYMVPPSSFIFF